MKFTTLLILFIPTLAFSQNRIYVSLTAAGANTGANWTNAFTDFALALQTAETGDTIWVAQGTYYPTSTTDRAISFQPKSGVRMYGGFQGTETQLIQRDWNIFHTQLSGDIGVSGDSTDNSYSVMYMLNPDSTTVLNGFTVADCMALYTGTDDNLSPRKSGGGLYIMAAGGSGYPLIQHCTFKRNSALRYGGGICINGSNNGSVAPLIRHCTFENNFSQYAAGIYKDGGSKVDRYPDIDSCAFLNNYATTWGGGIYFDDSESTDSMEIQHCDFQKNRSGLGSCIFIGKGRESGSIVSVQNCIFDNNTGGLGGIFAAYNVLLNYKKISISHSEFIKNNGGIMFISSPVVGGAYFAITNCRVENNFGTVTGLQSLFLNIACPDYPILEIKNTIFENNNFYGIIQPDYPIQSYSENDQFLDNTHSILGSWGNSTVKVINSVIKNQYLSGSFNGLSEGILFGLGDANMEISNCVINASNSKLIGSYNPNNSSTPPFINITNSFIGTKGLYSLTNGLPPEILISHSLLDSISYCSQYPTIACGAGNIFGLDPMFSDTANNNYHLLPCSPLINAGTNTVIQPGDTDLDGNPRIRGGMVDIGPYESAPFSLSATPAVTAACTGTNAGAVSFVTEAVCEPITYAWTGPNNTSGSTIDQLAPGTYQITLTDHKNDSVTVSFSVPVNPPATVNFQTTAVFCGTTTGGSVIPTVTGAGPFLFQWNGGVTDSIRNGLAYGIYTVTITDQAGCTVTATAQISRVGMLQISIDKTPIACVGDANGAITIQPANGAGPFVWTWYDGSSEPGISGLAPGNYTGTLTDALGCGINWIIPLEAPAAITAPFVMTPATGPAIADGSITIQPAGGTGNITSEWSNGATGLSNTGLVPGFYTVTLTDANGCVKDTTIEVSWSVNTAEARVLPVKVWPNPVSDWVSVQPPTEMNVFTFTILDAQGQLLRTIARADAGGFSVWLGDLAAGVYTWQVVRAEGNCAGEILVKE